MQLFYEPKIEQTKHLNADDSKHCIKVLRKQVGDVIHIVDGAGGLFKAQISDASHKKCSISIVEKQLNWNKATRHIHLAIAPTKNLDRITYFVEKAVEIGISEISFILCKHSERKIIKTERIERIAVSAMKQSLKAYMPKINELQPLSEFVKSNRKGQLLVAHLKEDSRELIKMEIEDNVTLLIGPEGDFDANELLLLESENFTNVTLGTSRLRTETAGLVGVTLLNLC